MSAPRVALSTTTVEPGLTGGRLDGLGVYSRELMGALARAGCEVRPFSFAPSGAAAALTVGRALPRTFAAATLRDLLPATAPLRLPADLVDGRVPDLFHATDYRVVRMDRPVVATLHDALPIAHPEWCNPRLRRLKNWLQAKAARKADHVITGSRFSVTELVECFGVDPARISVVYNGVGDEWFEPPAAEAVAATLAQYGLRPGYFLFVGTLQPRKNLERLLQAYLQLPPVLRAARQLVVVGAPGWRSQELVRRLEAARQQGENVVWLSALTEHQQLRHLYAGSGVFVFPSLYEGFGLPIVEAFAAGVPVVASNATSMPEVCLGAALEVDPTSVAELAAAMAGMARDEALRARCIAAGRRRALELTWAETARRTRAVYHSVLSS